MPRLPFPEPDRTPPPPTEATESSRPASNALSVSEAAELIKSVLAEHVPSRVRIVGEVSNLSDRQHWFFSLKDSAATLRCVMFASSARRVAFPVRNGMQVVATGRLDFFPGQGHVQLYVDALEPVGVGALELALRAMMEELRERGYFDPERKKPLPVLPRRVAVVTSRAAAALQDVINTAGRRWPGCRLFLYDVRVQGKDAAPEIAAAIASLSRDGPRLGIDAIILTRGGGSIEDLWAFNERVVADALVHCSIPVVAAIGHETDTTVAELVADVRCSTPTQAAMTLIPDAAAMQHQLDQLAYRLVLLTRRDVRQRRQHLDALGRHPLLRSPAKALAPARDRLDRFAAVFRTGLLRLAAGRRPDLDRLDARLRTVLAASHARRRDRLDALARHLDAISPGRVLERGYSYTLGADGRVLRHVADAAPGDRITTCLADGTIKSIVEGGPPAPPLQPLTLRTRRAARPSRAADEPRLF
jgi:exodeoxyribonuclease VII large subunit